MRISDWSSDVCSSDLALLQIHVLHLQVDRLVLLVVGVGQEHRGEPVEGQDAVGPRIGDRLVLCGRLQALRIGLAVLQRAEHGKAEQRVGPHVEAAERDPDRRAELRPRSEENTSEIQSLMSISYAVLCLKKKTN